jgi:hypothetical protein
MVKIACCHNCAYSYWDPEHTLECMSVGLMNWPACANHPESLGRMRRMPERGICPNYRPRPETPQGEVRQIPLGDGYHTYVDATDYEWLSQWTWRLCGRYAGRMEKGRLIFMHREIMQPPEGMIIDHKNRNRLDNTRDHLRPFTHAENARNRSKPRGTTSQFRGVSHDKKADKYQAQIHYNGSGHYIGYFTDEIEAARAHDYRAVEVFGDDAHVNFPEEWPPERRAQVYALRHVENGKRKSTKRSAPRARRRTPAAKGATKSKRATGRRSRATASKRPNRRSHGAKRTTRSERATGRRPRATSQSDRAAPKRRRGRTESA